MDSLNDALEKWTKGESTESTKEKIFETDLNKYIAGIIRTVYDFAEQQPDGVFVLIDFHNKKVDAMVQVKEYLVKVSDLIDHYDGYHFTKDPEKLKQYFQEDYNEIVKLFHLHKKMVPQRIWSAMNIQNGQTKLVYSYTNLNSNANFGNTDDQIYNWALALSEIGWQSLIIN